MTKPVNASPATTLVLSPASPPSQEFNTCPQRAQQPWHNPVYTRTPPPPCSSSRTHRQGHRRSSSRGCRPGRRHSSRYDCSPSRRRSPIRGRSLSRRRSLSRSCSPSRRRSSSRRYSNRSRSPSCWSSSSRGRRPTRRRFTSRSRSPSRRCSSGRIDSLSHRRPSKHTLSKTFRGSLDGTAPVSKGDQGDQPHATASQTTSRCTQAEADQGEQVRLPVESVERTLRTVVHAAGHAFTGYNVSDVRLSYRCSSYRSTKCKAKIHYIIKSNEYELCGEHSCTQKRKMTAPGLAVTEDLQEATDVMALTRMDLTAERIWKHIRQNFYPDELTLVQFGLTREQVIQRVHRTRRSHFGADLHGIVDVPPLSLVSGTNQPFYQFYRSYGINARASNWLGPSCPYEAFEVQAHYVVPR
ncbi:hypothetical protein AM587_10000887 [Phytophthora nicotianae]|nr:hypothetical protein AM587_10000887 [Phytophthora nicotianae]